ncbi:hypothetical protein FBUS_01820 [Fasciolopsis buskii]|uniref:Uncharacterized protein n=1 Tax=Fasciolopsis buskii TaxID=27845 RepID=A0A8E0RUM0_9TREM|nr:hypothetical protein FBUS_01820 [Fasciolopsis buski]
MRHFVIFVLVSLLIVGLSEGFFFSSKKKTLTQAQCNKKISEVVLKCYEKALKKRKCGLPTSKTSTVYSSSCQSCNGCVSIAQECMLKGLKKGDVSKCAQAQQSVISLQREVKQNLPRCLLIQPNKVPDSSGLQKPRTFAISNWFYLFRLISGTPSTKTSTVYSNACQTCTDCVPIAQSCMVSDLQKGTVAKCSQAQQSVISLKRILDTK